MLRKWNCQDCCSIGDGRERERREREGREEGEMAKEIDSV